MSADNRKISGVWTAVVTPFQDDHSIDWDSFKKILDAQAKAGIDGVVICGTTGESPTLDAAEKNQLVKVARDSLPKNIRVMAGTGGNNTKTSVELSKSCLEAGADSILIVTPPYNKPNPPGMRAHYEKISESTQAQICLYHVHHRTGQKLSAVAISELTTIPNVCSVKEASGELPIFSETVRLSDASVLSGDDTTFLASLAVGGSGVISVATNIIPEAFVALAKAFGKGDTDLALKINQTIAPFINILGLETNPCPIKSAMASAGMLKNNLRLPMAPVSSSNHKAIAAQYNETLTALKAVLQ